MNNINFNNLMIKSYDRLVTFDRITDKCAFELIEMQNAKISNTEESSDLTGSNGRKIGVIKKNKAVQVEATSGVISGGMMAAQVGSEEGQGEFEIIYKDVIDVAVGKNAGEPFYSLTKQPVDDKILDIRILSDNGSLIKNNWTQGDAVSNTQYFYGASSSGAKGLKIPTGLEIEASDGITFEDETIYFKLAVFYKIKVNGAKITNRSDKYGKTLFGQLDVTVADSCDREYHGAFIFPRLDISGQFDIDMNGDQVVHALTAQALADTCMKSNDTKFWDFVLFTYDEETGTVSQVSALSDDVAISTDPVNE